MTTKYQKYKLIESGIDKILQKNMQRYFPDEREDSFHTGWNNCYSDYFIFPGYDSAISLGSFRALANLNKGTYEIQDFEIKSELQKKGYGTKLLEMNENIAKDLGLNKIILDAYGNKEFFIKRGFNETNKFQKLCLWLTDSRRNYKEDWPESLLFKKLK
jgi:GNAT superfamily N-acetyltransferase